MRSKKLSAALREQRRPRAARGGVGDRRSLGARLRSAPARRPRRSPSAASARARRRRARPIKLGGIDMLIPGVDFTTIGKVAKAYFKCVNDNGGINGRPIQYILYNEQLNPAQQAALARKLVESDKVVGIVGNTSFTECGTNWKYYKSKGFTVIGAGVQAECFGTPTIVESNMGPRYSNIGAAQALVRAARSRSSSPRPTRSRRTRTAACSRSRQARRHPGQGVPDQAPDHRRELDRPAARAGRRRRAAASSSTSRPTRRRRCMKAAIAQGLVDKVQVGLVDADRQQVHGGAVPAVRRQDAHQLGVRHCSTRSQGPTPGSSWRSRRSTRRRSRPRRSARWASWTRSSRRRRC